MKMLLKCADYKTNMDIEGEVTLKEVSNGIGVETDQGTFGIAQRDGGLEIVLEGVLVWSSTDSRFDASLPRYPQVPGNVGYPKPVQPVVTSKGATDNVPVNDSGGQ